MKVGITFSSFDLFHAGHIKMLEEAKANCDYLIVGLQTDPTIDRPEKNKPVQTIVERFIQLEGCKYIDKIIPYTTESDLLDILLSNKIDIRFVGDEYEHKDFTGKQICKDQGIQLYYNERRHRFSTTELRHQTYLAEMVKNNQKS